AGRLVNRREKFVFVQYLQRDRLWRRRAGRRGQWQYFDLFLGAEHIPGFLGSAGNADTLLINEDFDVRPGRRGEVGEKAVQPLSGLHRGDHEALGGHGETNSEPAVTGGRAHGSRPPGSGEPTLGPRETCAPRAGARRNRRTGAGRTGRRKNRTSEPR